MFLVQINSHDYELFKMEPTEKCFFPLLFSYTVTWNFTYNSISESRRSLVVLASSEFKQDKVVSSAKLSIKR